MNYNKVMLIGRVTRELELRHTDGGTAVTEISLAINREWTTSEGERRRDACFVDVVLWAKKAEAAVEHLQKGTPVFIEGRLDLDQWQGSDGTTRSKLRVVADQFQKLDKMPKPEEIKA